MTLATGEFIRHYKDYAKHFPMVVRAAWGYTFETATQAIRLVLSGVFDAYPRLKIVLGHLGGEQTFMPHYFFDLTDDKIIHDFKRKQLRDLKQAREHRIGHRSRCDEHEGDAFARAHF